LQRSGEPNQHQVRWIRLSQLDPSQVVDVDVGQFGELLLRQRLLVPQVADARAELAKKFFVRHLADVVIRH